MKKHTEDFKREAVRIAVSSGLSRRRVAADLGVGLSTLGKWVSQYRPTDPVATPQADLARENERLRLENRILKEEREILKRLPSSSRANAREVRIWAQLASCLASGDAVRVMQVSTRGYRSWHARPTSRRSRSDMKVLAHIREQYGLSLGSYGRPRMTMELKEAGLDVGERRVGRLMRVNGIRPVRTRKHKVTTNSNHSLGVAANWLDGDFVAAAPNQKMGRRHHLYMDCRGLALSRCHSRSSQPPCCGLGGQRQNEEGSGNQGARYGGKPAATRRRLHLPF